jgi:Mrp family chromosome partitioning ATPase/capsular polysaccharide biosynthesis protein
LSEASAETTVRLGPAVANLLRSIWRQRELVVLGLLLGLALGYWGLPKVLNTGSTYDVTVRMSVQKSPADSIFEIVPAIGGPDGQVGASTDVLKDIAIADRVAKSLREQDPELTGTLLLEGLTFTAVPGSPFVDITYADPDPRLATTIVQRYAELYAEQRNKVEMQRLDQALMRLKVYATTLQGVDRQAVNEVIRKSEVAKLRGPVTAVVGQPIVTTTGPPLSRPVTLALGLLLGLAIGAGAALLVETAFRKVITPTDAEEGSELPFIAAVRKTGIRRTPLPVIDRPFSPAAEDYRRVGTALERQGLGGDIRVLAIASADPGDGKSMLAANLAHSLARQGREVVLVSSDLRRPQVERLLGLGQRAGLAETLQDDPVPAVALLVSINDHLLVLPAGMPSKHPGELLASKRLHETIQTLRRVGIVILDTPASRLSADAIALSGVADATLIVARSGVTRMRSLHETTSGLRRDRIRQLGVVLVGTSSSMLRSLTVRRSYREPPEVEVEEPDLVEPQPVQFTPRPVPYEAAPAEEDPLPSEVTELNATEERKRRAAE